MISSYPSDILSVILIAFHYITQPVLRDVMESYQYNGQDVGGIGAYHIEYDYPGNPDYPTVRAAIAAQNAPKNEEKGVDNEN